MKTKLPRKLEQLITHVEGHNLRWTLGTEADGYWAKVSDKQFIWTSRGVHKTPFKALADAYIRFLCASPQSPAYNEQP
ncbi:hypothetical protein NIES4075_25130 [Tolypothrix sp. NIES-4075]|uniref:hypothetical protein n=1 Tax=Tolypothrix sp. NIES-4075 TaxID=2005459 RepID=UPI000B5D062E|nr:hypothetical protein [Tolypothrix sp. NIES-4075]GAX41540.1 hypothetical protein NIES4075_25130 [Tolypothrix sp. NIES-4075]